MVLKVVIGKLNIKNLKEVKAVEDYWVDIPMFQFNE
jgi:hypothetical protein